MPIQLEHDPAIASVDVRAPVFEEAGYSPLSPLALNSVVRQQQAP